MKGRKERSSREEGEEGVEEWGGEEEREEGRKEGKAGEAWEQAGNQVRAATEWDIPASGPVSPCWSVAREEEDKGWERTVGTFSIFP